MKLASDYCHVVVVAAFRSEDYVSGFLCFLSVRQDTSQLFSDCLIMFLGFCDTEFYVSCSFQGLCFSVQYLPSSC